MWIHLRQRSHCMRLGSVESPSPRWHSKHGGSSSSGVNGLSMENSADTRMWVVGVPLSRCDFATWKGHVSGHHSNRYVVIRLVLCCDGAVFAVLVVGCGQLGLGG